MIFYIIYESPLKNRAAVPRSKVFLFLSSFKYPQTMKNACQLQHIFYLFTEKLNTSEPPPGFPKGSMILLKKILITFS